MIAPGRRENDIKDGGQVGGARGWSSGYDYGLPSHQPGFNSRTAHPSFLGTRLFTDEVTDP